MSPYEDARLSFPERGDAASFFMSLEEATALIAYLNQGEMVEAFLESGTPRSLVTSERVIVCPGILRPKFRSVYRPYEAFSKSVFKLHDVALKSSVNGMEKMSMMNADDARVLVSRGTVGPPPAPPTTTYSSPPPPGASHSSPPPPTSSSFAAPPPPRGGGPGFYGTWQEAEQAALLHMRNLGFPSTQSTESGADRGLDLVNHNAAAQVKHLAMPVGRPAVQQLIGAAEHRPYKIFYSTSGYTQQAKEYAQTAGVALFVLTGMGAASADNPHAERIRSAVAANASGSLRGHVQARQDRKESEFAARVDFLVAATNKLLSHARADAGHPNAKVRKKADRATVTCEKLLARVQEARSPLHEKFQRNAILKDVERKLQLLAKERGVRIW